MKPIGLLIAAAIALGCLGGVAKADCGVDFNASTVTPVYDPLNTYGDTSVTRTFTITATRSDSSTGFTAQFVDLDDSAAPLHLGGPPIYDITLSGGSVVVGNGATPLVSKTFSGTFNGVNQVTVGNFLLSFAGAQNLTAGLYSETIGVQYLCLGESGTPHIKSAALHVDLTVPKTILATLGGASSGALPLGDMSGPGNVVIGVQSTSSYKITVTPDVGHTMALQGAPAGVAGLANAKMAYTVDFAGTDATTGATINSDTAAGVGTPVNYTLTVTPTELASAKRAGTYTGTITVRFSPQ